MRHTKPAIALLFLLTLAHAAAFGQTGGVDHRCDFGSRRGAVVSNAPIEARNSDTGVSRVGHA